MTRTEIAQLEAYQASNEGLLDSHIVDLGYVVDYLERIAQSHPHMLEKHLNGLSEQARRIREAIIAVLEAK